MTTKRCGCPCHSVGCAVCDGCAGKHRFTASASALSPEERAARAWERHYPIDTDLHRMDSLAAQDVKDGFIAGYLAALKEKL